MDRYIHIIITNNISLKDFVLTSYYWHKCKNVVVMYNKGFSSLDSMIFHVLLRNLSNPSLSTLKKENQLITWRRVPGKMNSLSWSRNFPPFVIQEIHFLVQNSLNLILILFQTSQVHTLVLYLSGTHFNIIVINLMSYNVWWRAQIMKLFAVEFATTSY